jgi:hypothetical protein
MEDRKRTWYAATSRLLPIEHFTNFEPEWDFQDLVRNGMIPQPFSAISKFHQLPKQQITLLTIFFRLRHLRLIARLTPRRVLSPISCFLNLVLAAARSVSGCNLVAATSTTIA